MDLQYRMIDSEELDFSLFKHFIRRQTVNLCWRRENGTMGLEGFGPWTIRPDPFIDDWSPEDYLFLVSCLQNTLKTGGALFGAFADGQLKGFVSVESKRFGPETEYLDLSSLHVSSDFRRRGAGRKLFMLAADWAKSKGAEKLYISSHSADETQRFYRSLGCVDAVYTDPHHAETEPYDCQLEFLLTGPGQVKLCWGESEDIDNWMELVRSVSWTFPGLETEETICEHRDTVLKFMKKKQAVCVKERSKIVGVLLFSRAHNMICCLAVSPDYRRRGIAAMLLKEALSHLDKTQDITVSTFREDDPKGAAPRALYRKFGFCPAKLTEEFGYPNQVFVLHG